jgi:phosphoglycerate dehydrogenase-like enzyme
MSRERPDRVLITEAVHAGLEPLGRRLAVQASPDLWADRRALLTEVRDCAALVVRNQTRVDGELVSRAQRLRVVGRLGAGLDNLDLQALRARGVTVLHGGGLNARAVAEYVIGAVLDLARGLSRSDRDVRAGGWSRPPGFELGKQVLGVVGVGPTGAATARLGRAVGMTVLAHDPYVGRAPAGVSLVPLEDLLRRSRVVTLHVPLTPETTGLIGARELAAMSRSALLVNAARGGVVDEDALHQALAEGRLGGAALDVRTVEPSPARDRFARLDNVLLTAHLAGLSTEAQARIAGSVLADVRRALDGRAPRGPAILPPDVPIP